MKPTRIIGPLISAGGENVTTVFDSTSLWRPIRHKTWVVDPRELRHAQPPRIPLRPQHGQAPIGEIVHLERRHLDGSVWAVAEVDPDIRPLPDTDYYLSVEATWNERDGGDVVIDGAALCGRSAMVGLTPITWIYGTGLDQHGKSQTRLGKFPRSLLERASSTRLERRSRHGQATIVHDEPLDTRGLDRLDDAGKYMLLSEQADRMLGRPLEIRPARIISVR